MPLHDLAPSIRCAECNEPIVHRRAAFMCWRVGHDPEYRHYIHGTRDTYGGYSNSCFSANHSLASSHQQDCLAGINPTGSTYARHGDERAGPRISALDLPAQRYGLLVPAHHNNDVLVNGTASIIEPNDDTIWPEGYILKLPTCWARNPRATWEFLPVDHHPQEEWYALSSRTTELFGHAIPSLRSDSND